MNCSGCNKTIATKHLLQCSHCRSKYHPECLNLSKEQFYALSTEYRAHWMCPSCSNITKRSKRNDNTPIRENRDPGACMDTPFEVSSHQSLARASSANKNTVTMDNIGTLLDQKLNSTLSIFMDDFRQKLKDDVKILVRKEIAVSLQQFKDEFTSTTDFICEENAALKRVVEDKSRTIKNLETEVSNLKGEVTTLYSRISAIDRMSRSLNLEIQAIPESKNENPNIIFNNICKTLKLDINQEQTHSCRRVSKQNSLSKRPRNLLVTLANPRLRDNVLSAFYRFNKVHKNDELNTMHLGLTCEKQRIYVTEHLSPECKSLHAAARKTAKEKGFKFVWVKYGRVYLRKDEGSSCILIKNLQELDKLN